MPRSTDLLLARTAVEVTIRVGLVLALIGWCLWLALPFIPPLLWGMIIAIALYPVFLRLRAVLGDRGGLAAAILTILGLAVLIGPLTLLALSIVDTTGRLTEMLGGGISIPPPPERLTSLPVVGDQLGQLWTLASLNFTSMLSQIAPQLRTAAQWLLTLVAGVSFGVVSFMASIVVAGLLLAHAQNATISAQAVARRLAGERGPELIDVAEQTIRGVTRGLLGTALVQSTLAGLGFLAIGLRGAAFLALICFFLCVIQIGPILVLLPAVIWVFMHSEPLPAVLFLVWCIFVGLIDNFLRPYLMSRGSGVPLLVILIGVLGGLIANGLIGLFIGPIVFALGYELFRVWVVEGDRPLPVESGPGIAGGAAPAALVDITPAPALAPADRRAAGPTGRQT
jgi:predicted PurR-regulated permease PerM